MIGTQDQYEALNAPAAAEADAAYCAQT